jgi:tryptophanyl-tRNA synthetase
MFTDPNHLRVSDPGQVEGNVVFMFLDYFDPNPEELNSLKEHYQRGGLGDGVLKNRLTDILITLISPIRERRIQFEADLGYVKQLLEQGTGEAREVASQKMAQVRTAMKLY